MSQMARDERNLAKRKEDRVLRAMIKDIARSRSHFARPRDLFAAPSLSIFHEKTRTPESWRHNVGRLGREKEPHDPELEWKQRCSRIFYSVVRANAAAEYPHYATKAQCLEVERLRCHPSIMPRFATQEDMTALFWQIGERLKNCLQLDISQTPHLGFDAIRALLITPSFGSRLRILQAQEQPCLNDQVMKLLASRCSHSLKVIDFSRCVNLTDTGLRFLIAAANLEAVRLRECPLITGGTLRTISGEATIGNGAVHLELLDISKCGRLHDRGWDAFAAAGVSSNRIVRLTYMDASGLSGAREQNELEAETVALEKMPLTGARMARALVAHIHLRVLNISDNNTLVTDRTLKLIGERLPSILSLNIARCRKISDKGLLCIAKGCTMLQAIHLGGLGKLTAHGIHALVHLRGSTLVLMNLSGLQGTLPVETIQPLGVRHLPFAEPAISFYGFKPRDDVLYAKVRQQEKFIEAAAAANVQSNVRGARSRARIRLMKKRMAETLQRAWRCYASKCRLSMLRELFTVQTSAAEVIQKNIRVVLWRMEQKRLAVKKANLARWLREMNKAATKIAALYRGYFTRENSASPVFDIVDEIRRRGERLRRKHFLEVVCKLQHTRRKRRVRIQNEVDAEEQAQRDRDCFLACRILQQAIRMFNAKMKLHYLWQEWNANNMHIYNACVTIQCMVREKLARKKLRRLRWKRHLEIKRRNEAASQIGAALLRGPRGRSAARIAHAKRHGAATLIQAWIRQKFVGHYSNFGVNELLKTWKNKMTLETLEAFQRANQKIKKADMGTDSASESDEEWEPVLDPGGSGKTIAFFSKKRNMRTEDPNKLRVWERSLVNRKIFFFDEEDTGTWAKCAITKYNSWKNKHKVVFADKDGDYKWVNLRKDHHLCMMRAINNNEGDFVMLRNLFPNRRATGEV